MRQITTNPIEHTHLCVHVEIVLLASSTTPPLAAPRTACRSRQRTIVPHGKHVAIHAVHASTDVDLRSELTFPSQQPSMCIEAGAKNNTPTSTRRRTRPRSHNNSYSKQPHAPAHTHTLKKQPTTINARTIDAFATNAYGIAPDASNSSSSMSSLPAAAAARLAARESNAARRS